MTLYASTVQIKAALRITDTVDDALISMAGSAASELIDAYCGRTFGTVTATRYYAPTDQIVCQVDDLAGTAVTISTSSAGNGVWDQTWTTTDYQLEPLNGFSDGTTLPYTRIRAIGAYWFPTIFNSVTAKVVGTFGFPAVPSSVTQAAVIQSSRLFKRLDSPLGVAGFGDMGAMRVTRSVDPDVAVLLDPYKRMRGFA
jgi:hypothetical protein